MTARDLLRELAPAVVEAMIDVLEHDPELARRVHVLLSTPETTAPTGEAVFMRRGAFAARVGLSRRKLDQLIADGLPHVGSGRMLRIDVVRADAWIRGRGDVADEVVAAARAAARRSA